MGEGQDTTPGIGVAAGPVQEATHWGEQSRAAREKPVSRPQSPHLPSTMS